TPKLTDQAIVAAIVAGDRLPREQWPSLVEQLVVRPTVARLITADGRHHSVKLQEVTIERYLHRLRLDAMIPQPLVDSINGVEPAADRPMLMAIVRRTAFESEGTRNIFFRYLTNVVAGGSYSLDDMLELLNVVEARKPANVDD